MEPHVLVPGTGSLYVGGMCYRYGRPILGPYHYYTPPVDRAIIMFPPCTSGFIMCNIAHVSHRILRTAWQSLYSGWR